MAYKVAISSYKMMPILGPIYGYYASGGLSGPEAAVRRAACGAGHVRPS